ncbi:hypothetical protein LTR72_011922 [Exophiala xenobiotica]|nr:hypothetical protein LTR72_011922 [Exophiala xenobiotica]KAK5284029.1 hypothetical protein LTR14_011771 [Exophiala xenobiotica]
MAERFARCEGCRRLVHKLFSNTTDLYEGRERLGREIVIHESFTDLGRCATGSCDLCRFFRRELYYYSSDQATYCFSDEYLTRSTDSVRFKVSTGHFQLYLGGKPGPTFSTSNRRTANIFTAPLALKSSNNQNRLITLCRSWFRTCTLEHKKCDPLLASREPFLPKRLLDVGSATDPLLRLILSEDIPPPKDCQTEYLTLSYCWGPGEHPERTTSANHDERLLQIEPASLPRTFLDANVLARELSVRYLWIDALCIIQATGKDSGDWETQIPLMDQIYTNSFCTIAASGAEHNNGGLYMRRKAARWPMTSYTLRPNPHAHSSREPFVLEPKLPFWNVAVENSPLSKRGWVLQERMLSSRVLFWTQDALFWECPETHASEYESECATFIETPLPLLSEVISYMGEGSWQRRYDRKGWIDILTEYSSKRLTQQTDKLPAVKGIANRIASANPGQEYLSGVWRSDLVLQLAWAADYFSLQPPEERIGRAPSWSWASCNVMLCFRPGRHAQVCENAVTVSIDNATGPQFQHSLTLTGTLGSLRIQRSGRTRYPKIGRSQPPSRCTYEPASVDVRVPIRSPDMDGSREIVLFDTIADAPTAESQEVTVTCLKWIQWKKYTYNKQSKNTEDHRWYIGAMVVLPSGQGDHEYRRIGWADLTDHYFPIFSGPETTLTLL